MEEEKKIEHDNDGKCPACGKEIDGYFSSCLVTCSCGQVYMYDLRNNKKRKKKK